MLEYIDSGRWRLEFGVEVVEQARNLSSFLGRCVAHIVSGIIHESNVASPLGASLAVADVVRTCGCQSPCRWPAMGRFRWAATFDADALEEVGDADLGVETGWVGGSSVAYDS